MARGRAQRQKLVHDTQTGTERVQALADILHSALCRHSNKTRALIAYLPNCAQAEGTPYDSPKLHPGPCSNVGIQQNTDTQMAATNRNFASAMPDAKCNNRKTAAVHKATFMHNNVQPRTHSLSYVKQAATGKQKINNTAVYELDIFMAARIRAGGPVPPRPFPSP